MSIGDPNVWVRHPVFDRWSQLKLYFQKISFISLNVLYINRLFSLKFLCLYKMMALEKDEIYSMLCTVKDIV